MVTTDGYCEYDTIKIKLRVEDDSMRDEIYLYMSEINDLVNNRVIAKLGSINAYGEPLVYPLTFKTIPPVDLELKAIANNMVVAKIRLQNSEKPLLWDSEVKVLDNYLERIYGYTRAKAFQPTRTLTVSPRSGIIGATITISGTNFAPTDELDITFDTSDPTTSPDDPTITDATGSFSSVTFTVPTTQPDGAYDVTVNDSFGGLVVRFQVTS